MIIELEKQTTDEEKNTLVKKLEWMGLSIIEKRENQSIKLAVVKGQNNQTISQDFINLPHVMKVSPFKKKYKLASRDFKEEDTIIRIKGKEIGGTDLSVMAGPCSIEGKQQMHRVAESLALHGATILRGGAFKPRTSPYDFQGMGEEGLILLKEAAEQNDLLTVSEVMDASQVELLSKYVDILQVGTRNMQNFSLLKKIGESKTPVLLKRGFSATYEDFLMAAEYIVGEGNPDVILCERGIRTFETHTRNTLDIAAVPILKELTHLPVIVDPSHGTGIREMVAPMARAAVAAGAHGVMIEVHPEPDKSVSDAKQTISLEAFEKIMREVKVIKDVIS